MKNYTSGPGCLWPLALILLACWGHPVIAIILFILSL